LHFTGKKGDLVPTLTNLAERNLNVSSTPQPRDLLAKIILPIFLVLGFCILLAYVFLPDNTTGLIYKTAFSDWFKLWLGAFIGFASAIVTYYFSKTEG
jgi:hypothetical protein